MLVNQHRWVILIFFMFNHATAMMGQDTQVLSADPYQRVFVETDAFDSTYLQQLEYLLIDRPIDTTYFTILNDLAYFSHTRNLLKSYQYIQKGLLLTKQAKDTLWWGRFQITQGAVLLLREQLDSARVILNEAKLKVSRADLPFLNTQLGYLHERSGELDRAMDYALVSMQLGEELSDKKAMALAYSDLSNLFWKQSKFEVGLDYGLKAVSLFKSIGMNSLDYNFTLFTVGNNLQGLTQYNDARWYYQQCIKMADQYGFYNNLSDAYIFAAELDIRLGNHEEAIEEGLRAVKYAALLDNNFMLMRSWQGVGQGQLAAGQFAQAAKSLNRCIEVAGTNFGDEYYLSKAYESLGAAYAGMGKYKASYRAFRVYDSLKSDLFSKEADQRLSLLQTQFNAAQQEAQISKQQAELIVQNDRQTLIAVIASFLLFLLFILFFSYRKNKKKNRLLEKQNTEKEFLLKEIHHRVKNNLGIVSSLLALQSEQIEDANIKDVMLESQNRVNSMSMIHQKLYQGENLAAIEMKDYFTNLGIHILDSFGKVDEVTVGVEMKSLELDVDTALPLGLIVNELLTNAMKYAFVDGEAKGRVDISLTQSGKKLNLIVQDNGTGFDASLPAQGTGFGTQLVQLLVVQLGGKISYLNSDGTKVALEFSLDE